VSLLLCLTAAPAFAEVPSIVVTPYYVPLSTSQTGSAVSVITRDQIEQSSATSVANLLRTVPGVAVSESGGPGSTAQVRLRGGESGHTLVLIDGVRANDPSTANNEFDFSAISLDNVERIEILRGPQSSVYGSDAMGGVVNIITRKPHGAPRFTWTVEGGSYGTHVERLSGGFAKGDFSMLMSGEHVASSGFSRVGNRDHDEADGFDRWNGSISGRYAPADGPSFEFGVTGTTGKSDYDDSPPSSGSATTAANALNTVDRSLATGYGRLNFTSPDGGVKQSLTGFATTERRHNVEPGSSAIYDFSSRTVGAEYRATVGAGAFGQLLGGVRLEQEQADYSPTTTYGATGFDDTATRYALFAGDQVSPIDHLFLTFSGRYDGQQSADGFLTGRFTAAYEIPTTETKLRASLGTGAKRPTFFQRAYNLDNGITTVLQSEESVGGDVGIDQALFDGRLTLSATAFEPSSPIS
jgi:vitamin B12 transporter